MSYDYLFFNCPKANSNMSIEEIGNMHKSMGSNEDVKTQIGEVFHDLKWDWFDATKTWFGRRISDGLSFQVSEENGLGVINFMASRIDHKEVLELLKELNLIALDLQSEELIFPDQIN